MPRRRVTIGRPGARPAPRKKPGGGSGGGAGHGARRKVGEARRSLRIALGVAVVGTLAWAATLVPQGLARMEVFRIDEIEVEGRRHLGHAEVVNIAGIPPVASVWDDFTPWIERLASHPLVLSVEFERELPGTLRVRILEREAVALVATPLLVPVDRDGRRLPLDPSRVPMDLPVLDLPADPADEGRPPSAVRIRPLARVAERIRTEVNFWSRVSRLAPAGPDGVEVEWGSPKLVFRLPNTIDPNRLREAVSVAGHALADTAAPPRIVDLRYQDQVVVRYRGS